MGAFDNAKKFFAACEEPAGWAGCRQYVADNATFSAQSEPLVDIDTVEAYCDWNYGLGTAIAPDASYTLHASGYDEDTNTAVFFATFHGTHTGDGGPVPATNKKTDSDYVYVLKMDDDDKVAGMTKIWNAPWAMKELGWM